MLIKINRIFGFWFKPIRITLIFRLGSSAYVNSALIFGLRVKNDTLRFSVKLTPFFQRILLIMTALDDVILDSRHISMTGATTLSMDVIPDEEDDLTTVPPADKKLPNNSNGMVSWEMSLKKVKIIFFWNIFNKHGSLFFLIALRYSFYEILINF